MSLENNIDILLSADEAPRQWYNFTLDFPDPLPASLDHETDICKSQLQIAKQIRPSILLEQDHLKERWYDIPDSVRDNLYRIGRPTPLRRALRLEKYLDTPARIYFKREDTLLTGSFKLNTAIAQAYYVKEAGYKGVVSETGAGQWGMALALASKFYGLESKIFMAKCSMEQKPYKSMYGSILDCEFMPSPGENTKVGRALLAEMEDHPGDIGTAISEAINFAVENKDYAYLSGSNTVHVLFHQTLLGLETRLQLQKVGQKPDVLIACVSGGSNFGGLILPFLNEKVDNPNSIKFLGAESTAAPRLTKGIYDYDYSDYAGYTPKTKSYTMGHSFIPEPIHVGGLRQHNGNPVISMLRNQGYVDANAYDEYQAFSASKTFLETEGVFAAPESAHAIVAAIEEAKRCKEEGIAKNIVFLCSGSGFLDMAGYHEILCK